MKLKLNREYATRHLFVTLLMLGLGGWFGYDGFVRYPATPAAELYKSIEGSDAPAGFNLEAFKVQKTKTQYGFTFLCFLAALIVGSRLFASIEKREPTARELEGDYLERFKDQKTKTQYGFTLLAGLVALVVGLRLFASYRFDFEFDDDGFVHQGRRRTYSDIKNVDRARWEKKGIIRVDGITLDAWHHTGVKEFVEKVERVGK